MNKEVKNCIKFYKEKKKFAKKKKTYSIIFLSILLLFSAFFYLLRSINISSKCKDIDFAIDYYLTKETFSKFKRIDSKELIFSDENIIIYNIYGLSSSNDDFLILKCRFEKENSNSKWILEKTYNVNS